MIRGCCIIMHITGYEQLDDSNTISQFNFGNSVFFVFFGHQNLFFSIFCKQFSTKATHNSFKWNYLNHDCSVVLSDELHVKCI